MKKELESTNIKILNYLSRMKNDKVRAAELVIKLDEKIKLLKLKAVNCGIEEKAEILKETAEYLKGVHATLTDWIAEFDIELLRVQEAVDSLNQDDIEVIKRGFQKFVLEDTAFSVQNVSMMFYDFDRMIETTHLFIEDDN